jgi:hypothetical protein
MMAVLATWILALTTAAAPRADAGAGAPCAEWAARTVARVEKLPEQRWRDTIVAALAQSCPAIPAELRRAAGEVRGRTDSPASARLVAEATRSTLGAACAVPEPLSDARKLAAACPLPERPELRLHDRVLADLRAVDYAVLATVLRSLLAAREYDQAARRLLMNFTLSAALLGEEARKPPPRSPRR